MSVFRIDTGVANPSKFVDLLRTQEKVELPQSIAIRCPLEDCHGSTFQDREQLHRHAESNNSDDFANPKIMKRTLATLEVAVIAG
jgi:hypothetical protein